MFPVFKPDGWKKLSDEEKKFFRSLATSDTPQAFIDAVKNKNTERLTFMLENCSKELDDITIQKGFRIAILEDNVVCARHIANVHSARKLATSYEYSNFGKFTPQPIFERLVDSPTAAAYDFLLEWQDKLIKPRLGESEKWRLFTPAKIVALAFSRNRQEHAKKIIAKDPIIVLPCVMEMFKYDPPPLEAIVELFDTYKEHTRPEDKQSLLSDALQNTSGFKFSDEIRNRIAFLISHGAIVTEKAICNAAKWKNTAMVDFLLAHTDPKNIDTNSVGLELANSMSSDDSSYIILMQKRLEEWKKSALPEDTQTSETANGLLSERVTLQDGSVLVTVFNFNSCQQIVSLHVAGQQPSAPAIVRFDDIQEDAVLFTAAEKFIHAGGNRNLAMNALPQKRPLKVG